MRRPLMHGLPKHTGGLIEIRFNSSSRVMAMLLTDNTFANYEKLKEGEET
jgi:hypothetical protein